ncbi:21906_t:CDS:2 [Cetraspora pellucida]|uniref:21906_t:CDS:1 n=1 Tax=Cetraspora pellucida TaxID=1433469 RepID=A0A9N9HHZ8_9GLOM|nr:21906_t:CDS:2 [Cetraspora pellucida]
MESPESSLTFSTLLLAACESSANVVGMVFIGYSGVKCGIFTPTIKKILAKLVLNLFLPCLLFSQIGGTIDSATITQIWPLPVICVLFAIISGFLGNFGGNLLSLSKSRKKFIMSSIIFNNITAVPVGLIKAFASTNAMQIFESKDDETLRDIQSRGITYLLLSTLFVLIIRPFVDLFLPKDDPIDTSNHSLLPSQISMTEPRALFAHFSHANFTEETPLLLVLEGSSSPSRETLYLTKIKDILSNIMSPPICAGLSALIIGTIPMLKSQFFDPESPLYMYITANMKHIAVLTVPMTLVSIGTQAGCVKTTFVKWNLYKPVAYVITCRYLIMPIAGTLIVLGCKFVAKDWDWFIIDDPMFTFVAMCLACGPTAIDLFDAQDELLILTYNSYILLSPVIWFTLVGLLSIIAYSVGKFSTAL